MEFKFEVNTGTRQLSPEEQVELKKEGPRIQYELSRRFGKVACSEHGAPESLVTVLELQDFPRVQFSFKNICCDTYNLQLLEAARA